MKAAPAEVAGARFAVDALTGLATAIFERHGLTPADAGLVARGLVRADLRGVASHGVMRIPVYAERLRSGGLNPHPRIAEQTVTPVVSRIDGDHGMGFITGDRAMNGAIRRAREFGIALSGVHRSSHFGMGALFALKAIEAGCGALIFTNASPAMPAWGGRTAFLGASPLAAGLPGGEGPDFVLDMAMTVVARGWLRLAAQRGEPIAPGLALDASGRPTTDGLQAFAGVCLPFGGVKGAALAMLMDLLGGVLTGAAYGGGVGRLYGAPAQPQDVGHLFFVFRPDLFVSREEFIARMSDFAQRVKASPRADGCDEILIPGEREARLERLRRVEGIPLESATVASLQEEAARHGVPMPAPLPS